jgi:hypothetical protein
MVRPKFSNGVFRYKDSDVYDALFLKEQKPSFFAGCSACLPKVVKRQSIPIDQYFFASYGKSGYKECSEEYKTRRVLIKAAWVDMYVLNSELRARLPEPLQTPAQPIQSYLPVLKHLQTLAKPDRPYLPAPPLLQLEDTEKFRDEKDNIIEIEVRGEKYEDKIWFKARHVQKMLQLTNISSIIMGSKSAHIYGQDYATFHLYPILPSSTPIDNAYLVMFLTASGLSRILHNSKSPRARFYQEQVRNIYARIFGRYHDSDVVRVVIPRMYTGQLPCIYMMLLDGAQEVISVAKGKNLFKFGLTTSLDRRHNEHQDTYRRYCREVRVVHWAYIDPTHLIAAENLLIEFCRSMVYSQLSGHIEIIECISDEVPVVMAEMDRISDMFRGDIVYNLVAEIATLRNRVKQLELE